MKKLLPLLLLVAYSPAHAVSNDALESLQSLSAVLPSGSYQGKSASSGRKCSVNVEYSLMDARAVVRTSEENNHIKSEECGDSTACFAFSNEVKKNSDKASEFAYDYNVSGADESQISGTSNRVENGSNMQIEVAKSSTYIRVEVIEDQSSQQSKVDCVIPLL